MMNTEQESIAENNKQNVTFSIGPSRVKGKMFLGKREDNEEAKNGKEQQVQLDKKAYECLLARAVELEKAYNDLAAECAQIEEDKLKAYNNLQSLERDLEQKHQRMESFASNTKAYKEAHDKHRETEKRYVDAVAAYNRLVKIIEHKMFELYEVERLCKQARAAANDAYSKIPHPEVSLQPKPAPAKSDAEQQPKPTPKPTPAKPEQNEGQDTTTTQECPVCYTANVPGARYCRHCGMPFQENLEAADWTITQENHTHTWKVCAIWKRPFWGIALKLLAGTFVGFCTGFALATFLDAQHIIRFTLLLFIIWCFVTLWAFILTWVIVKQQLPLSKKVPAGYLIEPYTYRGILHSRKRPLYKWFVFMHTHRMGLLDVCNYRVVIPPRYEMMTWKKKQRLLTVSLNGDQFDIDINGKFVDEQ